MTQKEKDAKYHNLYPWRRAVANAKQRCTNPNNPKYKWYKNRKFDLTPEQGEILWNRDKAYLMKKPTLDRENNDEGYTFKNCRFIEHKLNSIKDQLRSVLQFDMDGNFIKEYVSIKNAADTVKVHPCQISRVCKGEKYYNSSAGFIWKYKGE